MIVNAKILMEKGSWSLKEYDFPSTLKLALLHSRIAHDCPLYNQGCGGLPYLWHSILIDQPCHVCGEYPPEELVGLWTLHNFDYIQACR